MISVRHSQHSRRQDVDGRVAQVFDFAGITNGVGAPSFAFFVKGGHGNARASGSIPSLRNKSYSTGTISAHPCNKRKGGAPSVETLHIDCGYGWPTRQSWTSLQSCE